MQQRLPAGIANPVCMKLMHIAFPQPLAGEAHRPALYRAHEVTSTGFVSTSSLPYFS